MNRLEAAVLALAVLPGSTVFGWLAGVRVADYPLAEPVAFYACAAVLAAAAVAGLLAVFVHVIAPALWGDS